MENAVGIPTWNMLKKEDLQNVLGLHSCNIIPTGLLYPNFLLDLLTNPNNPDYKNSEDNIRSYNSAASFASMGTKVVDFSGAGPYAFKVHGQIRHRTSHIQSVNGPDPQYAQLYVIE
ncbi:hypothetical protein AVEN_263271-1 [Araneus ventricosus]|uniref:Uncharacterized protein n=1 Tax=Araneus ventricosus TaxID=182803 RepID=A0A4Y2WBU9_ARAVE|nr:hypothetical protein AVEN_263271-1 [Araneus ventricosus]